ncbi:FeoA family protein [Desulfovermiculus halophilus]|jgi:Fe2+ transport system protein FeoA|uniref:FeoA family protein n=1 Tax=Desulfovermiculus halophilus TaxID=339722 RepID=UPI00048875C5|nr:FeoA family protein [Desulfovermiculus halophilus]
MSTTLRHILPGNSCTITAISADGGLGQRLFDLGLLPGQKITVLRNAPLKDPVEVEVGNTLVSLRREEAAQVEVQA